MLCRNAFGEMLSLVNGRKLFEELKTVVVLIHRGESKVGPS